MKTLLKKGTILLSACVMFLAGYWYKDSMDYLEKQEKISSIRGDVSERNDSWDTIELTEEDKEFLQEYVFGAWSFSKRIIALEEEENDTVNFTSQGVEEIQNNWIRYSEKSVQTIGHDYKYHFSKVEDIFLFAEYGGCSSVSKPVYHIERQVDEERIKLRNISGEETYIQFPEECELVHVYYDLGYDENKNASVKDIYLADDIYVNPDKPDVLYLNFCGLWELKREIDSHNTGGKSPTGKG